MKLSLHTKKLSSLLYQRNLLLIASGALLVVVLLQGAFLFLRSERTILVPPELRQGYWVEGDRFSPNYLEEMAHYFCHLLLDVTETNLLPQGEVALRYVAPSAYGAFKTKLYEDLKRLKKDHVSVLFVPVSSEVFESGAHVTGNLISYLAGKKISEHRETYSVSFESKQGRLFLNGFEKVEKKEER